MGVDNQGFSLIEALVALAVLAIATVGLVGAVEGHIDSTRSMERRATAMWVAENRMAELSLGGTAVGGSSVEMLGRRWLVNVTRRGTDDPEIARVQVEVRDQPNAAPLASLDGFLDTGTERR
jgi:general secretion pathway protein I